MPKADAPGMQAQRWIVYRQRLTLAERVARLIGGIAAHRIAEVRQVDANLIGTSGQGPRFQQRRSVTRTVLDAELSARR
jgi:hypothetical protein